MTIEIENNYPVLLLEDYREIIENVVNAALDYEQCPYEVQVYVLLTDDEEIHEINKDQRGIDRPTDVLSFPMADYLIPGDFSDIETREPDAFHPGSGELILGDIIISMDRLAAQAREYGHSQTRELAFLTAHSMLHLMGYDHMVDGERAVMEERQEEILRICGYSRQIQDF